jgi:hypothetical protein
VQDPAFSKENFVIEEERNLKNEEIPKNSQN